MARYTHDDYAQTVMVPISFEKQLIPRTWAFTIHELIQRRVDTSIFESRYKNDEIGCSAYDPKIRLTGVLFAYSRGIISSRQIERACREHSTFMALACGMVPDHRTMAAFISSMKDEMTSIFRDSLLVCAEQDLLGGTHFAWDGLKLPSNAAKAWSGTCDDLKQKQEQLEAKVRKLLEQHETADKAGKGSISEAYHSEQAKVQEQITRLEKQAARIGAFLEANEPKRGKRGKELQSNITDHDSAKMQTAHGVIQGYHGHALVDATSQVIVHAEACGNGQDYGHVSPMLDGAKDTWKSIGLPEAYLAGKLLRADSHDHSEANLQKCSQETLEAYIPDPHVRQRDPRVVTQERHNAQTAEQLTLADFADDKAHDCYMCPNGKLRKLEARRHKIGHNIYRRYEADAADCGGCLLREPCWQNSETRRKHLAVLVEQAKETLSQQMIAKIDTPEAREIDGQRLAIVEPVFGNIRVQKRLDRLTLRSRINVNVQWRLYCIVHNIEKIVHDGRVA